MGIKGLKRSLSSISSLLPYQDLLPSNIHLHIDASGFLFYISTKISLNYEIKSLGGQYDIFNEFIIKELSILLELGFHLTAYFDGKNRMKSATAEKRRYEQELRWKKLYELCHSKIGM